MNRPAQNAGTRLLFSGDGIAPITVQDVIEDYLAHARKSLSTRSVSESERELRLFCKSFGPRSLKECRPIDLEQWLESNPAWKSDWTIKRILGTIQRPFAWAERVGLIDRNPFRGLSHRSGEPGQPMDDSHWRALLRRTNPAFRRLLFFLRYTGCRPGEAAAVEWGHVDLINGIVLLPKHKTARTQRTPKPRLIVLHPVIVRLLKWISRQREKPAAVLLNSHGKPWNRYALATNMKRLRRRLGLPKTCKLYSLRYSLACRAVRNHVDIATVSRLMGHNSIRTTAHYVSLFGLDDGLQAAVIQAMKEPKSR